MINTVLLCQSFNCFKYHAQVSSSTKVYQCCLFLRSFSKQVNLYKVLGVSRDATAEDIRNAFIKKSKECHPDRLSKNVTDNHKQFVMVNEAYSVLSKPSERLKYDLTLPKRDETWSKFRAESTEHYEHPSAFRDNHFTQHRHESLNNKSYYGVPGVQRMSNGRIVAFCLTFMLIGITIHFLAVNHLFSTYRKSLDENDIKYHKLLQSVKENSKKNLESETANSLIANKESSAVSNIASDSQS